MQRFGLLETALVAAAVGGAVAVAGGDRVVPPAEAAVDVNGPALVFSDSSPCTAPCVQQDVVYRRVGSALNPAAGVQPLSLDLYRSRKTPKRDAPTIVLAHGGGFVEGNKGMMRPLAETFANAGFLVASIQYRLVPKDRNKGMPIASENDIVPASAEAEADMEGALHYLKRNAAKLGAARSEGRYAVGGYSAGAITSLRVAIRGGDKATPKASRFRIGGAFSIAGAECGTKESFKGCTTAFDRKDAPILLFNGEDDTVIQLPFATDTCTAATIRGGGCTLYAYPGQDHVFPGGTVFGGGKNLSKKQPAIVPTVVKFLRKELKA